MFRNAVKPLTCLFELWQPSQVKFPYLKQNRLGDVIAAIQAMAFNDRSSLPYLRGCGPIAYLATNLKGLIGSRYLSITRNFFAEHLKRSDMH
jgi:hypothetical protein